MIIIKKSKLNFCNGNGEHSPANEIYEIRIQYTSQQAYVTLLCRVCLEELVSQAKEVLDDAK